MISMPKIIKAACSCFGKVMPKNRTGPVLLDTL